VQLLKLSFHFNEREFKQIVCQSICRFRMHIFIGINIANTEFWELLNRIHCSPIIWRRIQIEQFFARQSDLCKPMSLGQPVHHKSVAFHQNRTEKGSNSPATAIQSKVIISFRLWSKIKKLKNTFNNIYTIIW